MAKSTIIIMGKAKVKKTLRILRIKTVSCMAICAYRLRAKFEIVALT